MPHLPRSVRESFIAGSAFFRAHEPSMPNLASYPEHNDRRFQADIVQRFRVAVRLFLARAAAELWRQREDRAINAAWIAGKYYAEYRRNYRHLLGLR